jgi:hypothetical protein
MELRGNRPSVLFGLFLHVSEMFLWSCGITNVPAPRFWCLSWEPPGGNDAYIPTIDGACRCDNFNWGSGSCGGSWGFVSANSAVPYFVAGGYIPSRDYKMYRLATGTAAASQGGDLWRLSQTSAKHRKSTLCVAFRRLGRRIYSSHWLPPLQPTHICWGP